MSTTILFPTWTFFGLAVRVYGVLALCKVRKKAIKQILSPR